MKTFLLRFEEETGQRNLLANGDSVSLCKPISSDEAVSTIVAGTKTLTEIRHESADADPAYSTLFALPR